MYNSTQEYKRHPLDYIVAIGHKVNYFGDAVTRHRNMLEQRYTQIAYQCIMLVVLFATYFVVGMVNWVATDFFVYDFIGWSSFTVGNLLHFWPLFLWNITLLLLMHFTSEVYSSHHDEELLITGLITGNLAGLWEEIGYRYLYICFAMISVIFSNWLLGSWFGWPLIILTAFGVLTMMADAGGKDFCSVKLINGIIALVASVWAIGNPDPWYWFYNEQMMPFINWLSFGSFSEIFSDPERYQPLMVMGAIAANFWFRDGHKYQGPIGWIDSWIVGLVFVYAMFTYGLITAIALHCLWNTSVYSSVYFRRKLFG